MAANNSLLSKVIKKTYDNSTKIRLLPEIDENSPNYRNLKVYFFGTSENILIPMSKDNKVDEIICHIIAISDNNPNMKRLFVCDLPVLILGNYKNPYLYELRFLENEENLDEGYVPLYDTDPLDRDRPIGEFILSAVAFCRTKEYDLALNQASQSIWIIINTRASNTRGCYFRSGPKS